MEKFKKCVIPLRSKDLLKQYFSQTISKWKVKVRILNDLTTEIKRWSVMSVAIIIDFDTFASVYDLGRCSCTAFIQLVANTSPMCNVTHHTVFVVAIWVQDQKPLFTGVEELGFVTINCWNRKMISSWTIKLSMSRIIWKMSENKPNSIL